MDEEMEDVDWDFFNNLPEEIILKILSYLSPYTDTKNAKLVNRRWNRLISLIGGHNDRVFLESVKSSNIVWRIHKVRSYDITDTLVPGKVQRDTFRTRVKRQNKNVPCPRFSHAAAIMGQYLYIFGGSSSESTSGSTYNDIFRLDLSSRSWEKVQAKGLLPAPRECCAFMGYKDFHGNSKSVIPNQMYQGLIVMYGGWCQPPTDNRIRVGARFFEDTQIFHINTSTWERVSEKISPPSARAGHSASIIGNKMVIFGGSQRNNRWLNDVWVFDINSKTWTNQYIRGKKPRERFGHSQFTLNDQSIIIVGGCGGANDLFVDAWVLNIDEWSWTQIKVDGGIYEPPDLWCHGSVMVDKDLIVFSEEKKCPHCGCPVQFYNIPDKKVTPNDDTIAADPSICACGRRKPDELISIYDTHLQMYILDCTTLLTDFKCKWLPYKYLQPAPLTRKLFSATLGLNEILLFGGLSDLNRNKISRSDDCTIAVKAKPSPR